MFVTEVKKKASKKHVSLIFVAIIISVLIHGTAFARHKEISLEKDALYDVYYEISKFEINKVKNVKISGIATVEDASFVVFSTQGIGRGNEGYIRLNCIKAILPHGTVRPERMFDEAAR